MGIEPKVVGKMPTIIDKRKICIYIMSSNATPKYTLNILQTLSAPFGWVSHFRFQKRLVDEDLWKLIPMKGENLSKKMRNIKVVSSYLYQREASDTRYEWEAIYPFRFGFLVDAFKTGDSDIDVGHLFVKVNNYVSYENQSDFKSLLMDKLGDKFNQRYASLGESLDEKFIVPRDKSKSAFHKICESIIPQHLRSPKNTDYYPVLFFIEGFKNSKGDFLEPKYDSHSYRSFYEIKECDRYAFEFCFYFREKPEKFEVNLSCDNKIFSNPAKYKLKILSRYDEESWGIISSLLERDIWTSISFSTKLQESPDRVDNKEYLHIDLEIPIKVKRKIQYRIIDFVSDIGFTVGTASIALAKVIEGKWYWWDKHWIWFVVGGYLLFAICKGIIKFWRG